MTPRGARRDSPLLTGTVSGGGPVAAMWGLSRRTLAVGGAGLVLVAGLVVIRATTRGRPPAAHEQPPPVARPAVIPPIEAPPAAPVVYGPVLPPPGAPRPETEEPVRRAGRVVKRPVAGPGRRKLLQEGWEMYRAQRFEDARAAFDKLVAQPRPPGGAYLGLAKVAFQEGKYEEAAKWSRLGARASTGPVAVDAWLLLGDAYYRLNRHKEAQAAYNEAVKRDPTNETARRMLERAERKLR